MINLKNYHPTDSNFNLYRVDLKELHLDKVETASKCKTIQEFVKKWGITVKKFVEICDALAIQDHNLYNFYTYGTKELLVKEKAVYTNKVVNTHDWYSYTKQIFYDIYLNTSLYVDIFLNKVATKVMKERYPWMFKAPFIMEERVYPTSLIPVLQEPDNIQVHDLMHKYLDLGNLSLSQFMDLFNHKTSLDVEEKVSRFSIYENGDIFLRVDKEQSVYLKIKDFDTNDFKAVEERKVYGYYRPDGKVYPFETKQIDLHFFDHPLVKKLKQHFKKKNK